MKDSAPSNHFDLLRKAAGPTISGKIVNENADKLSILTKYGVYEVLVSDVHTRTTLNEGVASITITRGAKLVFSRLIDADSLMVRSKANLAQMALNAKQLHGALHKVLGQPRLGETKKVASEDCPMCDCVDCCECPVVDCDDDCGGDDSALASKYYDEKSGKAEGGDYRKS